MSGKTRWFCVLVSLVILLSTALGAASAEVPRKVNYQGRLTDSATGEPEVGSHDVTFRIYNDPAAGDLLWSETQTVNVDTSGVFSAILGSVSPIDTTFEGSAWLEIEVGDEILLPRREIVSVPFAFQAEEADRAADADHATSADSLGGYAAGYYVREGETSVITSEMIVGGAGSGLDADMLDSLNADAFADTGHMHDDRYYTQDLLSLSGTLNEGSNPVDWTKLKNVPAGFADGSDDVGGTSDGHSLDAADGDPVDAVYVDDDGKVGIGTALPASKLDVVGEIDCDSLYKIDGSPVLAVYADHNLAVGVDADLSETGWNGTFVGYGAGKGNTGSANTFIGSLAGHMNEAGSVNTFIGTETGHDNTTGNLNTFVGYQAGMHNSDGDDNCFFGASSGHNCTSGSDNTFVGTSAGTNNQTGNMNTYLGAGAGGSSTGSFNVSVGAWTGSGAGGGTNNVFLGYMAGYGESGSHKLYIANDPDTNSVLIYGDFSSRRIGMGTLDPEHTLHIAGAFNPRIMIEAETGNAEINFKNTGDTSGEKWAIYKDESTDDLRFYKGGDKVTVSGYHGGVGVGTTDPSTKLAVAFNEDNSGHTDPTEDLTWGTTNRGLGIHNLNTTAGSYVPLYFMHGPVVNDLHTGAAITSELEFATAGRAVSDIHFWVRNGDTPDMTSAMNIQRNGDVGIGTADPYGRLHVVGNKIRLDDTGGTKNLQLRTDGSEVDIDVNNANLFLKSNTGNTIIQGFGGYVGISTTSPGYALQVGDYGDGTQARANAWNIMTSKAYSKDVQPLAGTDYGEMLQKLVDTEVVRYVFADDNTKAQHIGLMAEDAPPEIVTQDGKALSLSDYSAFLLAAIKAQQEQIEALESEVQELRALVAQEH